MSVPLQLPVGPELFILLVFPVLLALAAIAVSALIYRDAKRRDSSHALAWAVGAFFGGLIVWILYFVVRDEVGPGGSATGGL
ncbi:hypothetical protein [Halorubrum laminariae]|uniref:Uncharacterized protein n=1 Tax=Halorubrum laminariae TaxID=1433523 RepID=A0ABD6C3I1_9EURY|nr:hypothetical protein [Halorubrum laminariae]